MNTPAVTIENPLLRTPLSLLVDDSCPVINLTYYWICQRHEWKEQFAPNQPFNPGDGDPDRLQLVPQTIPATFARKWGEWCDDIYITLFGDRQMEIVQETLKRDSCMLNVMGLIDAIPSFAILIVARQYLLGGTIAGAMAGAMAG